MIMFKHTIAPVIAFAATVGLFALPDAASADSTGSSVTVRFADLDLSTMDGQQKLERRIERAARQVCATDEVTTGTRVPSAQASACYHQALRNVRSSVATAVAGNRPAG
jgi:UrcA family protein